VQNSCYSRGNLIRGVLFCCGFKFQFLKWNECLWHYLNTVFHIYKLVIFFNMLCLFISFWFWGWVGNYSNKFSSFMQRSQKEENFKSFNLLFDFEWIYIGVKEITMNQESLNSLHPNSFDRQKYWRFRQKRVCVGTSEKLAKHAFCRSKG
jgi:hypothetical protein